MGLSESLLNHEVTQTELDSGMLEITKLIKESKIAKKLAKQFIIEGYFYSGTKNYFDAHGNIWNKQGEKFKYKIEYTDRGSRNSFVWCFN